MPAISSISIVIKAITTPFIKGISGAFSIAGKFINVLGDLSNFLRFAGDSIKRLIQPIVKLGLSVLQTAANFESLQTQFITLLGGSVAAKKRFQELKKFAAETPFQLEGIAQASKILESFAGRTLSVGDGLRLVGNAAAKADRPITEVALTIGRAFAGLMGGRAVGEPLARLQELSVLSNVARNRIEDLQKAGQKGAKVWKVLADELKRNDGLMGLLSQTANGLVSTVKDNLNIAMAELGAFLLPLAKVLMVKVIARFEELNKWIEKNTEAIRQFISSGLKKIIPIFLQIGVIGASVFQILLKVFRSDGPLAIDKMADSLLVFLGKVQFVTENIPEAFDLAWAKTIQLSKIFAADMLAVILTPFAILGKTIVESFKFALGLIIQPAKFIFEELGIALQRAFTLDDDKLKELDLQLADLLKRKDVAAAKLFGEFDFVGDMKDVEKIILKLSDQARNVFGVRDQDLKKLEQRLQKFNERMQTFGEKAAGDRKKETLDLLKDMQDLIDKGEINLDKIIPKPGEFAKAIKKIGEPKLAIKGSQAAARGELGLLSDTKEMLKEAKKTNIKLDKIKIAIEGSVLGEANFGFG